MVKPLNTSASHTTRNFYDNLFSPDSDSVVSENLEISQQGQDIENNEFIFSGLSMVGNSEAGQNVTAESSPNSTFLIHRSNLNNSSSDISGSDMDISSESSSNITGDIHSAGSFCSLENDTAMSLSSSEADDTTSRKTEEHLSSDPDPIENFVEPVISFLEEDEIANLLGENVQLPKPEQKETLEKNNVDIIASFNVRNKYDHITTAEMIIKERLTFLSIQEPYASSHKASESWKAFQKLELSSARIACYETPYQMILFDSWKWGGRVILPFQSLQYGRVASIGFDLGNSTQVGIISIYAPSKDSKSTQFSENTTHPTMQITNNLVQKILSKWKLSHPNMITIILGDFQETISTLNRDNLGKYRQEPTPNGVLQGLSATHESVVRKKLPSNTPYVTRFGEEGARGIDHIFFPSDKKFENLCIDAKIKRDIGANYFPSDHSLLTCAISRSSQNNNCSGLDKTKYDYSKLFSIKLSQHGHLGKEFKFDTSQFKDCQKYKDQFKLYGDLLRITNNNSNLTNAYIGDLEIRANALFEDLWTNGVLQDTDGSTNKLVDISEANAAELSYILQKFNSAVKTVMTEVKLDGDQNNNDSAGKTRGRLRTRSGFKIFNNLPVPTKLRYLRTQIEAKSKAILKNIYWIKEHHIRSTFGENEDIPPQIQFWNQWNNILKDDLLLRRAKEVSVAYDVENTERMLHVSAMQHEKHKRDIPKKEVRENIAGNSLPHVSDNITRLLNFWLSSGGCNQGFNTSLDDSGNTGGSIAFLSQRILDWKTHLTSLDIENFEKFDLSKPHQLNLVQSSLERAQSDILKLQKQIIRLQTFYRQSTLNYFLESKNISSFTNKVSFQSRQAPAAHTSIWDDSLQDFRTCKDEIEELEATSAFHGKWMANSASAEVCAFAKIRTAGRLGNRGIELNPNRVVTMADISKLIHNGDALPRRIKKSFLRAHGPHTANLFKEPDRDNPHFFYPFYLLNRKGEISEEAHLERNFWKAIATVPTKARFEGFQLAVVGRFDYRWRQLLLKIVKLILIMRYIPASLKKMARFPIPKPGRHNEYRPISLCHDLYCYIMGVVTSYSSAAIAKAGILHGGLTAYQKGKGCANLVTTELCFREDCVESHVPSVQIDEDEEKFFDRIPVEVLLAAMRVNGFPNQGYIEIKASAMEAKTVEIITAKGITYAKFICGLEQGNPDSPTISNLVIKFKHDVWGHISKEIKAIFERNNAEHQEKYKFNSIYKSDGQLYLCKIGYSDDNSKYISIENENDLLELVSYFTQLSGDISMVTKIGRKSAKCEIQFFNITAKLALQMQKVWSTAWSFVDDSPLEEQIPFKIHMKSQELKEFYRLSNFFDLPEEEQLKWNTIIEAPAHKHLGLSSTLSADTSAAWMKTLEKMREKLIKLNIHKMHSNAQRKCFNMLVGTIPTFAPLQMNFPSEELRNFDKYAASFCLKANGMSASDTKLRMFLPESKGGIGMISTMELDIISTAREFEIISNNKSLDSDAFRTRIGALDNYPLHSIFLTKNHAREAIAKLARYGIFVRSSNEEHINEILAEVGKNKGGVLPLHHSTYKDSCTLGIGLGKEQNIRFMYGGQIHSILRHLQDNEWKKSDEIESMAKICCISIDNLLSTRSEILKKNVNPSNHFFSFWEWRNIHLETRISIPGEMEHWKYYSTPPGGKNNESTGKYACKNNLVWDRHIRLTKDRKDVKFNTYTWEGRFLKLLMESNSPLIVATDGSHSESELGRKTTSGFVLCMLDIGVGESLASKEWVQRKVIPILSRTSILPKNFGTSDSDIAHGESCALLLAEMAFLNTPRITITDSKAIRETMMKIRDLEDENNDRSYIRSIAGGTGKFICGLMKELTFNSKNSQNSYNHQTVSEAMKIVCGKLKSRNEQFLTIAKTWIEPSDMQEDTSEVLGWEAEYFDDHVRQPLLKVNSHQLNISGTGIKSPPRYKSLIPNLSMLSANHYADRCADYARAFTHSPYSFNRPYPFLRFYFTCGHLNIDRNISEFLHEYFSIYKVRKLRLKETQGLLWRLLPASTTSWELLRLNKGWFRMLLGLSSTHTRRVYKSEIYRECCKAKFKLNMSENPDICKELDHAKATKSIKILSGCMWCRETSQCTNKGNRNHAMLSCRHENINNFRRKTANLIESKFRLFFLELKKSTNMENVKNCIKEIEKSFLYMQEKNEGRSKPISREMNKRYVTIDGILERENFSNVYEALNSKKFNFCCEIFGVTPWDKDMLIQDSNIGVIDCAWLGLTPKVVDTKMKTFCNKVGHFVTHKETANALKDNLRHSWEEIKTLLMGRAIGLHRLICSTGNGIEKAWRKEFNVDINSFKKIKEEINPNETIKLSKRKAKICISTSADAKGKRRKGSEAIKEDLNLKICNGITCNRKHKSWYQHNNFATNKIRTTIKQCQRCGRYMTAIKQCRIIVQNMLNNYDYRNLNHLYLLIKENQTGMQHNYTKLFSLINNCLHHQFQVTNIHANKRKIFDRYKLIGNIFCISIKKVTNNFTHQDHNILQRSLSVLNKVTLCKESDFNLNREAEIKIKLLTSNNVTDSGRKANTTMKTESTSNEKSPSSPLSPPSPPSPPAVSSPSLSSSSSSLSCNSQMSPKHNAHEQFIESRDKSANLGREKKPTQQHAHPRTSQSIRVVDVSTLTIKNKGKLAPFAADIIRPSVCLLGDGMMKAVEVLRSFKIPSLYVASAEASNQINAWRINQTWTQFAKMFGSKDLIDTKPNGTYLIPMFSGGKGIGHWFLFVIRKLRRRFSKAWCIDSMGKGNVERSLKQKIEQAFAPGRSTMKWEICESRSQEELECGPRTILAMRIIKEGMEKDLPMEDSIRLASMWQHPYNLHTPTMIREEAAYLINRFTPAMITAPIRIRVRNRGRNRSNNILQKINTSKPNTNSTCIEIHSSQEME